MKVSVTNNSLMSGLVKTQIGAEERKLKKLSDESGLLMIEQTFIEQLQNLYEEENQEDGSGYYRELIPYFVQEALKGAPQLGVGEEIYQELIQKINLRAI